MRSRNFFPTRVLLTSIVWVLGQPCSTVEAVPECRVIPISSDPPEESIRGGVITIALEAQVDHEVVARPADHVSYEDGPRFILFLVFADDLLDEGGAVAAAEKRRPFRIQTTVNRVQLTMRF